MSTEDNKVLIRRFYEEVFNRKNTAAIDEFIAPNIVDQLVPPGMPGGIEGTRQTIGMYLTGFPDLHFTLEDQIAEGDKVVSRITARGTHQGEFMRIPPTGKPVTVTVIDINRIAGGKLVEHWAEMNMLGLLQQVGVLPSMG